MRSRSCICSPKRVGAHSVIDDSGRAEYFSSYSRPSITGINQAVSHTLMHTGSACRVCGCVGGWLQVTLCRCKSV